MSLKNIVNPKLRERGKRIREVRLPKHPVEIVDGPNPVLQLLKSYYEDNSFQEIIVCVDELPPSTNKIYDKHVYKNQKTKKHYVGVDISADVEAHRIAVRNYFKRNSINFKPKNILAVTVELYSPRWLNKDKTPKEKDADNTIKSLFDAIEKASHIPDENIFYHHPFKMYAEKEKTVVTIYEIESKIFTS